MSLKARKVYVIGVGMTKVLHLASINNRVNNFSTACIKHSDCAGINLEKNSLKHRKVYVVGVGMTKVLHLDMIHIVLTTDLTRL